MNIFTRFLLLLTENKCLQTHPRQTVSISNMVVIAISTLRPSVKPTYNGRGFTTFDVRDVI